MVAKECKDLGDLHANLLRDLGDSAKSVFITCAQKIEEFIWDRRGQIPNDAGAEAGFYTTEHYNVALENLKRRIKPGDDPSKVNQPIDDAYVLGDTIISNFIQFEDPQKIYDKIEKKKVYFGGVGEASFILKGNNSDLDNVPPAKPEDADNKWTLTEAVLTDYAISPVVRAALVYERSDFGHEPWKKFHAALADPKFIATMMEAPLDQIAKGPGV